MSEEFSTEQKLKVCREKRELAANCLFKSLSRLLKKSGEISETNLRDEWLVELRKDKRIFEDGWYNPPPHGISVLFGNPFDEEKNRINFLSLRPESQWPKDNVFLDRENGLISCYCSPLDKVTGMIGDFGGILYFGKNKEIMKHLKKARDINRELFDKIKIGMKFKQLYSEGINTLERDGLEIECYSSTDPTSVNFGHSIPCSFEEWSVEELNVLRTESFDKVINLVSKKRKFINSIEELKVKAGMAFTLESRFRPKDNKKIPLVWYHNSCIFHENGEKELLENFNGLFKLAGMDFMLE